jgi:RNA polymerase sigma factor (sigma-70 family)
VDQTSLDDAVLRRRWSLVLPHRQYLVRIAVRRGLSSHDAEDCAHEAMTRCVGFAGLDESRVLEWLATATMRLCVDRHRLRTRDERLGAKLSRAHLDHPSPEEAACDRGEAAWVATHVAALPESQRAALAARAEGLTCGEIAARMGLSYKAVESLLSRARTYVRTAVASAYVTVAAWAGRHRTNRPRARAEALSAVAFATAAVLVVTAGHDPRTAAAGPGFEPPAPAVRILAPARPAPAAARSERHLRAPVPRLTPAPAAPVGTHAPSPGGVLPKLPPVPTDPCEYRVPHASTCVPVGALGDYQPGEGLKNCLEYGVDLSSGFECRESPPADHQ